MPYNAIVLTAYQSNPAMYRVWRAFLTLSPGDQKAFAERISNRN